MPAGATARRRDRPLRSAVQIGRRQLPTGCLAAWANYGVMPHTVQAFWHTG